MKVKIVWFCGLYLALVVSSTTVSAADQFVLSKPTHQDKKLSKNELKESIGQEIRDAFNVSTNINKQSGLCQIAMSKVDETAYKNIMPLQKTLGELSVELSAVQQKFSHLIERLVDNQKPFKKASHHSLEDAYHILQDVSHGLKGYEGQLTSLNKRLTKTANNNGLGEIGVFADLKKTTQNAVEEIKKVALRMNSCDGLKIS